MFRLSLILLLALGSCLTLLSQHSDKFRSTKVGLMAGLNSHSPTPPGNEWNGGVLFGCSTTYEDVVAKTGGHGKFLLERRFQRRWSFVLEMGVLGSKSKFLEQNTCSQPASDSLIITESYYSTTSRNDLLFRIFSGIQFSQNIGPIRAGLSLGFTGNANGAQLRRIEYDNGVPLEGTIQQTVDYFLAPSAGLAAVYQLGNMEVGLHYRGSVGIRAYDPRDSRSRSYPRTHSVSVSWGYLFGSAI